MANFIQYGIQSLNQKRDTSTIGILIRILMRIQYVLHKYVMEHISTQFVNLRRTAPLEFLLWSFAYKLHTITNQNGTCKKKKISIAPFLK